MNLLQYLLSKLSEECNEVSKEALKISLFGPGDHSPDDPEKISNVERLYRELNDLHGILELLNDTGFEYKPDPKAILDKKIKVLKYLDYSISKGMTDRDALYEYDSCVNPNIGYYRD
jgi:hypothetical protein